MRGTARGEEDAAAARQEVCGALENSEDDNKPNSQRERPYDAHISIRQIPSATMSFAF